MAQNCESQMDGCLNAKEHQTLCDIFVVQEKYGESVIYNKLTSKIVVTVTAIDFDLEDMESLDKAGFKFLGFKTGFNEHDSKIVKIFVVRKN